MAAYQLNLAQEAPAAEADPFQLWEHQPSASLAFAAGGEGGEKEDLTWQIALPADRARAQEQIAARQDQLQQGLAHLASAEERLLAMGDDLRFAAATGPEAELGTALSDFSSGLSFAPAAVEKRQGIAARWQAFVAQVDQILNSFDRIETTVEGQLIGRTAVGWSGDFRTELSPTAVQETLKLHQEAVQLALATRTAMLRLLIVVTTGVAKLALRLTTPGAQLLLLPAIYQFIRDVLQELRALPAASQ